MNRRKTIFSLGILFANGLLQFLMYLEQAEAQSKAPMAVPRAKPAGPNASAKGKILSKAKITEHIEYSGHHHTEHFTMRISVEIHNGTSRTINIKQPFELICENGKRVTLHSEWVPACIQPGKTYSKNIYFNLLYSDISKTYTLVSSMEGFEPIKLTDPDPPKP